MNPLLLIHSDAAVRSRAASLLTQVGFDVQAAPPNETGGDGATGTPQIRQEAPEESPFSDVNLTRVIPHELRTPLAGILGVVQLLSDYLEEMSSEEVREMLAELQSAARRLERLTENFALHAYLNSAVADRKEMALLRSGYTEDAASIIIMEANRLAARYDRNADLELRVAAGAVAMPEHYLRRLVEELVDNAFKFSGPGCRVCLTGRCEGGGYLLTIRDNGRGLNEAHLAHTTRAFVQINRSEYEQQGLGLGLALVRRMIALWGGTFSMESEPGLGTRLQVLLP